MKEFFFIAIKSYKRQHKHETEIPNLHENNVSDTISPVVYFKTVHVKVKALGSLCFLPRKRIIKTCIPYISFGSFED